MASERGGAFLARFCRRRAGRHHWPSRSSCSKGMICLYNYIHTYMLKKNRQCSTMLNWVQQFCQSISINLSINILITCAIMIHTSITKLLSVICFFPRVCLTRLVENAFEGLSMSGGLYTMEECLCFYLSYSGNMLRLCNTMCILENKVRF